MAYVNVAKMHVRAHWSLVRSANTDDALGGRDKLRRSSDRGGRAGLRACALSHEIAESVREGRVAAPGVSVTAHLPTIEHVSPQVVTFFPSVSHLSVSAALFSSILANNFFSSFFSSFLSSIYFRIRRPDLFSVISFLRKSQRCNVTTFATFIIDDLEIRLFLLDSLKADVCRKRERERERDGILCERVRGGTREPSGGSLSLSTVIMSKMAGTVGRLRDNEYHKCSRVVSFVPFKWPRSRAVLSSGTRIDVPSSDARRFSEARCSLSSRPRRKWISFVERLFLSSRSSSTRNVLCRSSVHAL